MLKHVEDAQHTASSGVAAEKALQFVVDRSQHLGFCDNPRAHACVEVAFETRFGAASSRPQVVAELHEVRSDLLCRCHPLDVVHDFSKNKKWLICKEGGGYGMSMSLIENVTVHELHVHDPEHYTNAQHTC